MLESHRQRGVESTGVTAEPVEGCQELWPPPPLPQALPSPLPPRLPEAPPDQPQVWAGHGLPCAAFAAWASSRCQIFIFCEEEPQS